MVSACPPVLNEQKLTLLFNNVLSFGLADAKVAAPPNVASINQRSDTGTSAVDIIDRRGRRAFLPRGQELCRRRCLPAAGQAGGGWARRQRSARAGKAAGHVAAGQGKAIQEIDALAAAGADCAGDIEDFRGAGQGRHQARAGGANAPQTEPAAAAEHNACGRAGATRCRRNACPASEKVAQEVPLGSASGASERLLGRRSLQQAPPRRPPSPANAAPKQAAAAPRRFPLLSLLRSTRSATATCV